jgi:hypothetical protein
MTRLAVWMGIVLLSALSLAGAFPTAASHPGDAVIAPSFGRGPQVNITDPKDGAHLEEDHFTLKYEVANFTLNGSAMGGANRPGEGHVHVSVDGSEVAVTANTSVSVSHLKHGQRKVKVALHNNDHTPLDPEVADEIHVEVPGPHLSVGHPEESSSVNTFEVEIEFHVEHFMLESPGQANADGRGHIRWRVLKDGAVVTKDPEVLYKATHTHAELKAQGCTLARCDYTLEAWLANNDGTMVEGAQRLSVTFTVLPPDFGPVLATGFFFLIAIGLAMLWALKRRPGEAAPKKESEEAEGLSK